MLVLHQGLLGWRLEQVPTGGQEAGYKQGLSAAQLVWGQTHGPQRWSLEWDRVPKEALGLESNSSPYRSRPPTAGGLLWPQA